MIGPEGEMYRMCNPPDCIETITLEDIIGDFSDLYGNPLLVAEENTNREDKFGRDLMSFTWTFYNLATVKGTVALRWLGESNGYYSEDVGIKKIK